MPLDDCSFTRIRTFYWDEHQIDTFNYQLSFWGAGYIIDFLKKKYGEERERGDISYREMIGEITPYSQKFLNKEETHMLCVSICPRRYVFYRVNKGNDHFKC